MTKALPADSKASDRISLGRFQNLTRIGEGGMGVIYRGHHPGLNIPVAVKVIKKVLADNAKIIDRFKQEASLGAQLTHPNIIRVFDCEYDADRGIHYIVQEYVDGKNLREVMDESRNGIIEVGEAVRYVRQVALALKEMHRLKLCHRDVKPENIMITRSGDAKLGDLGICKSETSHITGIGAWLGSGLYMAPEQSDHAESVSIVADIYSLGVVFFEMVTGERYALSESAGNGKSGSESGSPRHHAHEVFPAVPPDVSHIIEKMTAADPFARFQTPDEFIQRLEALSGALPDDNRTLQTTSGRKSAILMSLLATAVITAGFFGFVRHGRTSNDVSAGSVDVSSGADFLVMLLEIDRHIGEQRAAHDYWTSAPRILSYAPTVAAAGGARDVRVDDVWNSHTFYRLQDVSGFPVVNRQDLDVILREQTVNLSPLSHPDSQFAPKLLPATIYITSAVRLIHNKAVLTVELTDLQTGAYIDVFEVDISERHDSDTSIKTFHDHVIRSLRRHLPLRGKILSGNGDTQRVNLGRYHGVTAGMAFTVFDGDLQHAAAGPATEAAIGVIRVESVGPFSCTASADRASGTKIEPGMVVIE